MTHDADGSAPMRGSQEPVAWAALDEDGQVAWIGYTEEGTKDGAVWRTVVPLYRSPTLTDAEREAVGYFADFFASPRERDARHAATLRGLLKRLG